MTVFKGFCTICLVLAVMFAIAYGMHSCSEAIGPGQKQECAGDGPTVVVIEGCQYFRLTGYGLTHTLTHKGNCTNVIHHLSVEKQ